MKWEDLEVYRPLAKDELKPAFKDFINIIATNLSHFGFKLHGRKLVKQLDDLLHVIHIDTRGSWAGISEYFKIEIAIVHISDKSPFVRNMELTASKKIEDIVSKIRNHYRVTKEYPMLADFLTRIILNEIIPYFDTFSSSLQVLKNRKNFRLGDMSERNESLILFCELKNKINIEALKIINKALEGYITIPEYTAELTLYKSNLLTGDWDSISAKLAENKIQVLRKLK